MNKRKLTENLLAPKFNISVSIRLFFTLNYLKSMLFNNRNKSMYIHRKFKRVHIYIYIYIYILPSVEEIPIFI